MKGLVVLVLMFCAFQLYRFC